MNPQQSQFQIAISFPIGTRISFTDANWKIIIICSSFLNGLSISREHLKANMEFQWTRFTPIFLPLNFYNVARVTLLGTSPELCPPYYDSKRNSFLQGSYSTSLESSKRGRFIYVKIKLFQGVPGGHIGVQMSHFKLKKIFS